MPLNVFQFETFLTVFCTIESLQETAAAEGRSKQRPLEIDIVFGTGSSCGRSLKGGTKRASGLATGWSNRPTLNHLPHVIHGHRVFVDRSLRPCARELHCMKLAFVGLGSGLYNAHKPGRKTLRASSVCPSI